MLKPVLRRRHHTPGQCAHQRHARRRRQCRHADRERQITTGFWPARSSKADDVILISAGASGIIAGMAAVRAAARTGRYVAATGPNGKDLAAQIGRLSMPVPSTSFVTGSYDLERSPWAQGPRQAGPDPPGQPELQRRAEGGHQGHGQETVLYVDLAYYVNLFREPASPGGNGSTTAKTRLHLGGGRRPRHWRGAGPSEPAPMRQHVSRWRRPGSLCLCRQVYLTPNAQRLFGDYAQQTLSRRW